MSDVDRVPASGQHPQPPTYAAWWSEKPDDRDIILLQNRAWASMATLPSHVEVRPAYGPNGQVGWGSFIERDVHCHHCGRLPEGDGDHSCPCPYRDEECPDHLDTRSL